MTPTERIMKLAEFDEQYFVKRFSGMDHFNLGSIVVGARVQSDQLLPIIKALLADRGELIKALEFYGNRMSQVHGLHAYLAIEASNKRIEEIK